MGKDQRKPPDATALRRRAEKQLRATTPAPPPRTPAETQRLLHELQVHQIELELQNEELRQTRADLEASLDRVTALYDGAPVGYVTLDRAGTIRQVNLTGAALLGTVRAALVGTAFRRFLPPAAHPAFQAFLATVFTQDAPTARELALQPDGAPPRYVRLEALAAEAGDECRVALLDVTERTRAEAAARRATDELEERVRERTAALAEAVGTLKRQAGQLRALATELTVAEQRERRRLAEVLHDELQQLLVATRLRAHMLGRSPDATVQAGAHEIVTLLAEALAQTRSLVGELSPPALQHGHLRPALEWLARWMEEKHKLAVHLRPPAAEPAPLAEDVAVLLYQAVRELLLNAVKYAQVAAAEVTLTSAADSLTCTVADAGVGFDPTTLRVLGGTEGGIGLLGIRERLELLGGRIEIESAPGQGSRFTLWVPLQSAATALQAAPSTPPPPPPVAPGPFSSQA